MDVNDYPEDQELAKIESWDHKDFIGLMGYVRDRWHFTGWGWHEDPLVDGMKYRISTGGWSGNEDLIEALRGNDMFWMLCWQSSRRGGHHEFTITVYAMRRISDEA